MTNQSCDPHFCLRIVHVYDSPQGCLVRVLREFFEACPPALVFIFFTPYSLAPPLLLQLLPCEALRQMGPFAWVTALSAVGVLQSVAAYPSLLACDHLIEVGEQPIMVCARTFSFFIRDMNGMDLANQFTLSPTFFFFFFFCAVRCCFVLVSHFWRAISFFSRASSQWWARTARSP